MQGCGQDGPYDLGQAEPGWLQLLQDVTCDLGPEMEELDGANVSVPQPREFCISALVSLGDEKLCVSLLSL